MFDCICQILKIGIVIWILKFVGGFIKRYTKNRKMLQLAFIFHEKFQRQVKELAQTIPDVVLPQSKIEQILRSDVKILKQMLDNNEITSEQLVNLYTKRACTIGLNLSLITGVMYDEAIKQAKQCDQLRKANPEACKSELFGIPISIKNIVQIKGQLNDWGCLNLTKNVCQEDGMLIKLVKQAGAIPFVQSNMPQSGMDIESYNRLYGRAKNPWDISRTTGGSSGGEAGLISSCCSPIGIGSDIGGSIRIPASFCGCTGFKPTAQRFSMKGINKPSLSLQGFQSILGIHGPMGKNINDCIIYNRVLRDSQLYAQLSSLDQDPYYNIVPFNEREFENANRKMKIGYYKSLSIFPSVRCSQRAVELAKQALEQCGHELVEIQLPQIDQLCLLIPKLVYSCNLEYVYQMIGDEPLIENYQQVSWILSFPRWVKKLIKFILEKFNQKRISYVIESVSPSDTGEYKSNTAVLQQVQIIIINYLKNNKIDAILSPTQAVPSFKHGFGMKLSLSAFYAAIWNALNFPTGSIPISVVQPGGQNYDSDPINDFVHKNVTETMKNSMGLPIGVQLSTYPYEDEKCLFLLKQLEEKISFSQNYPYKLKFD